MPQALPFIGVTAGTAAAIGAVVAILAKPLVNFLVTSLLTKKPGQASAPVNVTIRSTVAPRRLVLGRTRAAGSIVFVRCSGTNNKYLWYVVAYAGHQCSDVTDLWLDKIYIPDADINAGTGAVATASLDGKLFCWTYNGTQAQTADTNLDSAFAAWTSNHRLRGICYRVLRMERSDKAWPTGAPNNATSLVDGALVYDPRLDTTNGGSGSHRRDDPQTWAFSRNWALIVRHYLSGGSVVNDQATRLIRYGLKEDDSRIDDAYTIAAANISDQSLSGGNAPPSGAEVRYTCDLEALVDEPRRQILEDILAAAAGQLIYLHGQWRIYAAAYDAPSHAFDQDDLFGEMEVDDTSGEEDRFNSISAIFIDAAREWTEQPSEPRTNAAYVTQDGGEEIHREVALRAVTRRYQAQRVTEILLRRARQMRAVTLPLGRQGLQVAPWETLTFDHSRFGWSGYVFRCMERDPQHIEGGGMICTITGKAEASSVYTDLATADYTTGTSVVNSVQSEAPDAPTGLTASSLPRSIQFTWTLGEFWRNNGITELWEHTSDSFGSATKIWEGRGTTVVIHKEDFTTRYYWVRVRTIANQTSTTEPATNGVTAVALPGIDIVSDPQFALATIETHWWKYNPNGGAAATLTITGGALGGYAALTGAGLLVPVYLVSRRPLPVQTARGEIYTITIRARIPSAFSGLLSASVLRHARDYSNSTFDPTPASGLASQALGGLLIDAADIGADWTEFVGLAFVRDVSGISGHDLPRLSAIVGTVQAASGAVQVDYVSVQPGQNCPPRNRVYTGTTDLASSTSEYFHNLQYNSASGGTITLPFAEAEHIGARIYFEQVSTGLLTIAAQGGETLESSPATTGNRALAGRYARAYAEVISSTVWRLTGDL